MNWAEIKSEVEDLERRYKSRSTLIEADINSLYLKALGINVRSGNCREKFKDALIEVKLKAIKMTRKYNMKQHTVVVLWVDNQPHYITMSNLTDELVEKAIGQNPEYKDLFIVNKDFIESNEIRKVNNGSKTPKKKRTLKVVKDETQHG